jgi:hypothetical protein
MFNTLLLSKPTATNTTTTTLTTIATITPRLAQSRVSASFFFGNVSGLSDISFWSFISPVSNKQYMDNHDYFADYFLCFLFYFFNHTQSNTLLLDEVVVLHIFL